ncbi:regulatory P domain protein [Sporocytophaga myxococcoides]|uniref:Regulatory P domain protein n=1 Tax=Sporocytophaga myxococcoides TaxID=153721 RepID=A0A098LEE4_9BACT|nr:T9SS type A sorting domain-containing protein [Sporocytophaga myxococcoides]GAL85271.1 regulatory P domain protein [Sporocytophaga myxococcoides]
MKKILPALLIFFSLTSFAQFKTIHSDKTVFYDKKGESIRSFIPVKVESQQIVNEDTLLLNYRVFKLIEPFNEDCQATGKGWPWTGKNIILTKDEREIFINKNGDSIIFHKYADVNDTWIFWSSEENYFEATVIKKEQETFNIYEDQVTDSVMTVSVTLKKVGDNSPLSHSFNGKEWKISKKYGFVKTYDLLNFPEDINAMLLAGIEESNIGVRNLTLKDIYNFEVGDELHVREFENSSDLKETKSIHKVIDKSITAGNDSIVYHISVLRNSVFFESGVEQFTVNADTNILNVPIALGDSGINWLPLVAHIGTAYVDYTSQSLDEPTSRMSKRYIYESLIPSDPSDSCYKLVVDWGSVDNRYIEGLGGPYNSGWYGMFSYGRELVYYKKGSVEWGTPYDLVTRVLGKKSGVNISLSPNPATDKIRISSEGIQNTFYKVFNVEGREVLNGYFIGAEETVDVNSLKVGIYSMMILNEGGVIYTSRFVKN